MELKRRQPNKRKRLTRDDDNVMSATQAGRNSNTMHDLDRLMHLWTTTNEYKDSIPNENIPQQQHSPSGSSSGSSSPVSNHVSNENQEQWNGFHRYNPLNLSLGNTNNATDNNLMCNE